MKNFFTIILLISISISVNADDRSDKIKTLMEAQGLVEMFKNQLKLAEAQGGQMGFQIMRQMLAQVDPNDKFKSQFKAASEKLLKKLQLPWGENEIITAWGDYYGKNFSEDELEQLIEFYSSPLGKKEVSSTKLAILEFTKHFQKLSKPIFKSAMEEYVEELKAIAKECNCKRKK